MINCFIIDDERAAVNIIKNYVSRVDSLNLLGESIDPQEGLRLVNELKPDLLFLDIQMNKMTGIELASLIKSNTKIIFCTAYSEFAVESYELNAVDYLMKPISFDRFLRAVKRFDDSGGNSVQDDGISGDYIFIQTEQKGKMVRVRFDDIEFIEARGNYVAINCGSKTLMTYGTMRDIEQQLASNKFIRIHKSYIVPIDNISRVEKNFVTLARSSKQVIISRTYREVFMQKIKSSTLL